MNDLAGRVALVTGGGRDVGAGISQALAKAGAAVAVNYHTSRDEAEAVVAQIEKAGGKAKPTGQISQISKLSEAWWRASRLILAAWTFWSTMPASCCANDSTTPRRKTGTSRSIPAFMARSTAARGGSAAGGIGPRPHHLHHGRLVSGRRVRACNRGGGARRNHRADEIAGAGNGTNRNHGQFDCARLIESAHDRTWVDANYDKLVKAYPIRRLGQPSDVAPMVALLASDAGSWITGQVISISGGFSMV